LIEHEVRHVTFRPGFVLLERRLGTAARRMFHGADAGA
jgi:hypothetical protein